MQLSANISAICVFLDGFRLPGIHHWTPTASRSRYPCSGRPDILTISALGNYRTPRSTGVLYSSSWLQTWFKYSNMKLSFVSRPDVATTLILCISSLSLADKNYYKRWWSICHSTSGLKYQKWGNVHQKCPNSLWAEAFEAFSFTYIFLWKLAKQIIVFIKNNTFSKNKLSLIGTVQRICRLLLSST